MIVLVCTSRGVKCVERTMRHVHLCAWRHGLYYTCQKWLYPIMS